MATNWASIITFIDKSKPDFIISNNNVNIEDLNNYIGDWKNVTMTMLPDFLGKTPDECNLIYEKYEPLLKFVINDTTLRSFYFYNAHFENKYSLVWNDTNNIWVCSTEECPHIII